MWLLGRDIRLAFRSLLRARAFAVAAAVTLVLGIAAVVVTFAVYDAILLNPLPYPGADRLVMVWIADPVHGVQEEGFGYPTYVDWRESNRVFEDMAASIRDSRLEVRVGDYHDFYYVNFTTANLFSVLQVEPAVGRAFTSDEDAQGAPVAVISEAFATRFGGAQEALGRSFEAHHRVYTVVGVMPQSFGPPRPETVAWIPWPLVEPWGKYKSRRETDFVRAVARLKPSVTAEEAERDLDDLGAVRVEEAELLIRHYRQATNDAEGTVDLMLSFVEAGTDQTADFEQDRETLRPGERGSALTSLSIVVVADTSPINYLVLIGQIDLQKLYTRILNPPAVQAELQHPLAPQPVQSWAADALANWRHSPRADTDGNRHPE